MKKKRILLIGNIILIVALLVGVGFLFRKYQNLKKNPNAAAQAETKKLVDKVAALYAGLPKDETPTIATVQDKEKLKDQPFFKDANNGDKLLIFANARQALIYREETNKLINVGPIAIDSNNTAGVGGTKIKVTGKNLDDTITKVSAVSGVSVDSSKDDNKGNYSKPQVFATDESSKAKADEIASAINGEVVTSKPNGEDDAAGVNIVVYAN